VPELRGLTAARAIVKLDRAGFRAVVRREPSFYPDETVFEQRPNPGLRFRRGTTVRLTVASFEARKPPPRPPAPPVSRVSRLVGLDYSEAAARMEVLGIVPDSYPVRSSRAPTIVISQTPAPGTQVRRGARVRLVVSVGKRALAPALVPDTVGLMELAAHSRCRAANFTCRTILVPASRPGDAGRVVRQQPPAGSALPELTQMKLFVAGPS
jgi:eukaryotic-like serine/threonine-protein kinase